MMATSYLPSVVQSHAFGASSLIDPLKSDKFLAEDHENEISKWLKLENEPSYEISSNSSFTAPSVSYATTTATSQLPTLQPEFSNNYTSPAAYTFNVHSSVSPKLPAQSSGQTAPQTITIPLQTQYASPTFSTGYSSTYPVSQGAPYSQQYGAFQTLHYTTPQTQFSQAYSPHFSASYPSYSTTQFNSSYAAPQSQYIQMSAASNPPYQASSIVPAQVFQPQYCNQVSSNGSAYQNPTSAYQYLYPFGPQMVKNGQGDELTEDKKRKASPRPFVRRVRQTRPKVVEAKGAVQCKGRNRKKGTQCRNAALMEYIGPRPIYCAEHIELDPKSLYEKCKSAYQKEPGDNKGCKEVVLKEFGVCYKHYPDLINEAMESQEYDKIKQHCSRITDLLAQLERDAAAAKKKDGDLYQRKNKLIPKFQEMRKLVVKALESFETSGSREYDDELPSEYSQLSAPIILDGISVHIVEAFSSDDELSSPQSDSSLEDEFDQILN